MARNAAALDDRPPAQADLRLVGVLLALPLLGLVLLLAVPALDVRWQHQPSHFWLVLIVALINVVLGLVTGGVADRRQDSRLFLVSLVLLAAAGFLGLHALATPGVVLTAPNVGFAIAHPVGLLLASVFAAASARDLEHAAAGVVGSRPRIVRLVLAALIIGWGVASAAHVPLLNRAPTDETPLLIRVLAPIAIALYLFAALRYLAVFRARGRALPLAVAAAFVLLAEAMVAVALSRSWHATWWEWHVLMAVAFGIIFFAARNEYRREGSVAATFGGLYLDATLDRLDQRSAEALSALVEARRGGAVDTGVLDRLRREGFASDELALLGRSAAQLARVDDLFRSYVGPRLAEGIARQPALAQLGGRQAEVSILFADLMGFTTFSEGRSPAAVIEMLNSYWQAVVPVIVGTHGGVIERFAGDAVMAVFNALDDQPDHPVQAVGAALGMRDAIAPIAQRNPDWPRFRIGVHSGAAVIGNVGSGEHHSFAAIGDTTNVAARVQAQASTDEVLVSGVTYEHVRSRLHAEHRGTMPLKGRVEPVEIYRL